MGEVMDFLEDTGYSSRLIEQPFYEPHGPNYGELYAEREQCIVKVRQRIAEKDRRTIEKAEAKIKAEQEMEARREIKAKIKAVQEATVVTEKAKVKVVQEAGVETNVITRATKQLSPQLSQEAYNNARDERYGLTPGACHRMFVAQNGACAICGGANKGMGPQLYVDHDHVTGKVRGMLCVKHNTALGAFGDNIEHLQRAIKYLQETQ